MELESMKGLGTKGIGGLGDVPQPGKCYEEV